MKKFTLTLACAILTSNSVKILARAADFTDQGWQRSMDLARQAGPEIKFEEPKPAKETSVFKSGAKSLPANYDAEKAQRLAAVAGSENLGYFDKQCYGYVASHMEHAGIIRPEQWGELGIGPDSAADFATWANANPVAMKRQLGLEKMETPMTIAELPVGGIVVYERGACGFSEKHGHIEIVVSENKLCSDGCEGFDQACLDDDAVRERIHIYIPVK
jgi:hypothetical protein